MTIPSCPECGSTRVVESIENQEFQYGQPGHKLYAVLKATMPVDGCQACGFAWTDYRGDEARDAAVAQHLKAAV